MAWMLAGLALLLAVAGAIALFAPVAAQAVEPVFGLRGVLAPAVNQSFATTLTTPNGTQYGIAGASPAVEETLTTYAARGDTVKVWGTVQLQPAFSNLPVIIATSVVLDNDSLPTPTPQGGVAGTPLPVAPAPGATVSMIGTTPGAIVATPAPPTGPTATITVYAAYVRSGPGREFATIGEVKLGEVCRVIGRSVSPDWLQLQCPAITGWVLSTLYTVNGSVASLPIYTAPTLTPAPPTPTLASSGAWRVLGYANPNLEGSPAVTFDTPVIDYAWGEGPAHPALPVDQFSLRFDRVSRFVPGEYQISVTYDDGVRLYINGQLVINDWADGSRRTQTWQGQLAGDVPMRVEYYDAFSEATLKVLTLPLAQVQPTATPVPPIIPSTPPRNAWLATYYNNTSLQPPAVFSRQEPLSSGWPLNYEFNLSSPVPGVVNEDNWSARWQGRFDFQGGDYRFNARGRDGVRVYIDGIRVINAWPNTQDVVTNTFDAVGAGEHEITVDMYNLGGQAWVRAWWERIPSSSNGPARDP
jgi:hypothetical protein